MQELRKIQNSPQVAEYGLPSSVDYTPVQGYSWISPPISTGNISQITSTLSLNEYRLVSFGVLLATGLAKTLDQIRAFNEQAIYPIMSILEPYMKATEELDLRMAPLSTKRVTINVTDRGRAKPDLYIE